MTSAIDARMVEGAVLATKGYYAIGDGGGATYLVAAAQAVDGFGDHELANGNVALLQAQDRSIDVAAYGVAYDGSDEIDKLLAISAGINSKFDRVLFDSSRTITLNDTFLISAKSGFTLSGMSLVAQDAMPAGLSVLDLRSCSGFTLINCEIDGNRDTRSPTAGSGHNFYIISGQSSRLIDCKSINATNDGFHFASSTPLDVSSHCADIDMLNCFADNCHRQGMSVIQMHRMSVKNCRFTNTNGTAPEAGVDFESDGGDPDQSITDVSISNTLFEGNAGYGLQISNVGKPARFLVENCVLKDNTLGAASIGAQDTLLSKNDYIGCTSSTLRGIIDIPARTGAGITISGGRVSGIDASSTSTQSLVYIHSTAGTEEGAGNFTIRDVYFYGSGNGIGGIQDKTLRASIENCTFDNINIVSGSLLAGSRVSKCYVKNCAGFVLLNTSGSGFNIVDGLVVEDHRPDVAGSGAFINMFGSAVDGSFRNISISGATQIPRVGIQIGVSFKALIGCSTFNTNGISLIDDGALETVGYVRQNISEGVRFPDN